MQFKIDIQSTDTGWQVQIFDPTTGKPIRQDPRQLRRLGDSLQAVPLPPAEELAVPPSTAKHFEQLCYALCTTSNVADVINIFARIINRASENGDMEVFGCYLFDTLLGKETWEKIQKIAGHSKLELALTWQSEDQAINRLPWEMMHGPEKFLAEMPGVAITRLVSGTAHLPSTSITQPRVLFVVGTEIGKDVIRPGAEYLGLMRTLQQTGLRLKTHLLLRASTVKLSAAIKWFQPTIVHFICHGGFDGKTSYLEFMSDENPTTTEPILVRAANLLQALRPDPNTPLPSVVILSACSMANAEIIPQEAGQLASPLAVELVKGGIPIVVGMAGEVSDQACRLFSRRFFEALLQNGDIAHAVAEGRRGGIISHSGSDPRASVDWALPTLFLSEGLNESPLKIDPPQQLDWHAIAEEYASTAYPSFCDRLELFQLCDLLMADTPTQMETLSRLNDLQVLAIAVDSPSGTGNQYGRTRLLEEMAAHVVRDGHVPCLLTKEYVSGGWPKVLNDLLTAIMISANFFTAQRFGLKSPPKWKYIPLLIRQQQPGENLPDWAAEVLKEVYWLVNKVPTHPLAVATAFRLDLLQFLDNICHLRPAQEQKKAKLLLLIDDVHMMDTAASDLLQLITYGLRGDEAKKRIRVIFTYSTVAGNGEGPAVDAITKWLPESKWAESITLTRFTFPIEARLAYQQFFLNWREGNGNGPKKALTIAPGVKEGLVKNLFRRVHNATRQGIPAYLTSAEVLDEVQGFLDYAKEEFGYELLREAHDDDALKML